MKPAMFRGLKATPLTSYGAVSRVSTCQTRKGEAAELFIFSIYPLVAVLRHVLHRYVEEMSRVLKPKGWGALLTLNGALLAFCKLECHRKSGGGDLVRARSSAKLTRLAVMIFTTLVLICVQDCKVPIFTAEERKTLNFLYADRRSKCKKNEMKLNRSIVGEIFAV